ncbi:MAG: hypothetical protein KAS38_04725 [Anaerolineales bacterium]|nr:hypothetical protein [Anaerolineales bacterium]
MQDLTEPILELVRLGKGQYFGEIESMYSENSVGNVDAAAEGSVKLSLLPREVFYQLLRGSPPTHKVLENAAQTHLEGNLTRNGDCGE